MIDLISLKKLGNRGNYLGILELLAKFDPFLAKYIATHGGKGKGPYSYLSKEVCVKFINLFGTRMLM